jgi:four helix bundle protein
MDLVDDIYRLTKAFPRDEIHGLSSQMRRAVVSIPSNIAEGHSREHSKEFLQHISVAQASWAELQTQLEIAFRLRYVSFEEQKVARGRAESLARQLHALRNAMRKTPSRSATIRKSPIPGL